MARARKAITAGQLARSPRRKVAKKAAKKKVKGRKKPAPRKPPQKALPPAETRRTRSLTEKWFPGRPGDAGWYVMSAFEGPPADVVTLYGPIATDGAAVMLAYLMRPAGVACFGSDEKRSTLGIVCALEDKAVRALRGMRDDPKKYNYESVEIESAAKIPWKYGQAGPAWEAAGVQKITLAGLAGILQSSGGNLDKYLQTWKAPKTKSGRPKKNPRRARAKIPARMMRLG